MFTHTPFHSSHFFPLGIRPGGAGVGALPRFDEPINRANASTWADGGGGSPLMIGGDDRCAAMPATAKCDRITNPNPEVRKSGAVAKAVRASLFFARWFLKLEG